jgi:hypothetical protein
MNRLFLISAVFASSVPAFAATNEPVTCRRTAVQVVTPQTPANYTVSGELCAIPMERTAGATVQLLIPQPTTMNTGTSEKSTETSTRMPGRLPPKGSRRSPSIR